MPRLIPLPDKHGPAHAARLWFNPDHVVTVIPHITTTGTRHTLMVDLKLVGVPAMEHAWLGEYDTAEQADDAWQTFLSTIADPPQM